MPEPRSHSYSWVSPQNHFRFYLVRLIFFPLWCGRIGRVNEGCTVWRPASNPCSVMQKLCGGGEVTQLL